MSTTSISEKNKYFLWVRSGGKCQYRGCNKELTQDILTKRNFNQSYIAHIVADKAAGPRGCSVRSPKLADDINNLMLLCDTHHRLIDKVDVAGHQEPLLVEMKKEHEDRIQTLTAMAPNMGSHIVAYRANVGVHTPVITYESAREYLLPNRYPALSQLIDLGLINSPQRDRDKLFWETEVDIMQKHFNEKLKPLLLKQEIRHLSLFAFAPMPLLMKLGVLINDIQRIEVHQPVRLPKTWNLSDDQTKEVYIVRRPKIRHPKVALNISLSGTITDDRIEKILGNDCSIYTLTITNPFNDYLKHKVQLEDFSEVLRRLFDEIKVQHGATAILHIFPTMPIATAIELGRIWMPKADMPLFIYDENTSLGGFVKALEIKNE